MDGPCRRRWRIILHQNCTERGSERRNGAFFVERGVQNLLFALGLARVDRGTDARTPTWLCHLSCLPSRRMTLLRSTGIRHLIGERAVSGKRDLVVRFLARGERGVLCAPEERCRTPEWNSSKKAHI